MSSLHYLTCGKDAGIAHIMLYRAGCVVALPQGWCGDCALGDRREGEKIRGGTATLERAEGRHGAAVEIMVRERR